MSRGADPRASIVQCPGCGGRTRCAAVRPVIERCPRCWTPLTVSCRSLDVEYAVRERLYGRPRASVEVIRR
jgi:hypothetical protein